MAKFKFDADASKEAGNYQPVPDGEYVLGVKDCQYKKTSTGKHMLMLTLEVDEGDYIGRKVWTNVVFNGKNDAGHGLTVQALKAFGFEFDGEMEIDPEEWIGRTCKAQLTTEDYEKDLGNGRTETRYKNVIPTAGFITDGDKPAPTAKTPPPAAKAAPGKKSPVPF